MIEATYIDRDDRRVLLVLLTGMVAFVVVVYFDTFSSIVTLWSTTEAYLHGFLIVPISAGLIWSQRAELSRRNVSVSMLGAMALFCLSAVWLLSEFAGVQLIEQFAVVAMIPAAVLCFAGREIFRTLRFALLYLLFAVPFGDFLIPYLIDFTASFCVDVLNVLGIPVFRDGRFFRIPSGSYEVAKACSGLQYFIATFVLTTLFSHFLFERVSKRVLFIGFALVLAVIANGIRAATVVLLLHYSDLDIAAGEDHEFVGWIIFALMIVALVWIGNRFQDTQVVRESSNPEPKDRARTATRGRVAAIAAMAVAGAAFGPVLAVSGGSVESTEIVEFTRLPATFDGWTGVEQESTDWRPSFRGYSDMTAGEYRNRRGERVNVAVIRYASQRQDAEVSSTANRVIDPELWSVENIWPVSTLLADGSELRVREVGVRRPGEARLIWSWVEVNGRAVDGIFETKLSELKTLLTGEPSLSAAIIVSSPVSGSHDEARSLLDGFLVSFHAGLQTCLWHAAARDAECTFGVSKTEEG